MAKKTKTTTDRDKFTFTTPKFRVSYPHVFKAQAFKGGEPKFSVTMLFPKKKKMLGTDGHKNEVSLERMLRRAKIEKFGKDESEWPEDRDPRNGPIFDGDSKKYKGKEGYKGHWAVKATAMETSKPDVVDQDLEVIDEASEFYAGCYGRASVYVQSWDNEFGKGTSLYLNHVQKLDDGKNLSNRKAASETFTPVNSGRDEDDEEDENDNDNDNDNEENFY